MKRSVNFSFYASIFFELTISITWICFESFYALYVFFISEIYLKIFKPSSRLMIDITNDYDRVNLKISFFDFLRVSFLLGTTLHPHFESHSHPELHLHPHPHPPHLHHRHHHHRHHHHPQPSHLVRILAHAIATHQLNPFKKIHFFSCNAIYYYSNVNSLILNHF